MLLLFCPLNDASFQVCPVEVSCFLLCFILRVLFFFTCGRVWLFIRPCESRAAYSANQKNGVPIFFPFSSAELATFFSSLKSFDLFYTLRNCAVSYFTLCKGPKFFLPCEKSSVGDPNDFFRIRIWIRILFIRQIRIRIQVKIDPKK